jgi:hypothetical protein
MVWNTDLVEVRAYLRSVVSLFCLRYVPHHESRLLNLVLELRFCRGISATPAVYIITHKVLAPIFPCVVFVLGP